MHQRVPESRRAGQLLPLQIDYMRRVDWMIKLIAQAGVQIKGPAYLFRSIRSVNVTEDM